MSLNKKRYLIKQHDFTDCGAACLASVFAFYNLFVPISKIRLISSTDKSGTNVLGIVEAAEEFNFNAKGFKANENSLNKIPLPAIAHIKTEKEYYHYVVVYKVSSDFIWIMDPNEGKIVKKYLKSFIESWTGIIVLLTPNDNFHAKSEKISIIKRFFNLVKPHFFNLIQIVIFSLLYTLIGFSTSAYIQHITDVIIPEKNIELLHSFSILLISVIIFQILIHYYKNLLMLKIGQKVDESLIIGYFNHLLTLPQKFFDSMRIGEIVTRLNDALKIRVFIIDVTIELFINFFILFFSLLFMTIYSWKLTLIIFFSTPIYIVIYIVFNKINKCLERKMMVTTAMVESNLIESIEAIKTIKSFGISKKVKKANYERFMEYFNTIFKSGKMSILSNISVEGISKTSIVVLFWIGAYLVIQNELTLGELFFFYSVFIFFSQPIIGILKSNTTIQKAFIAAERLFEIIDIELVQDGAQSIILSNNDITHIHFQDVSFKYNNKKEIFEKLNINFSVKEFSVITGTSGSGKSTIINLLQKLYYPQSGAILFGNINLNEVNDDNLRKKLVCVPQCIDFFKGTIFQNIVLNDQIIDEEKIITLSKSFEFHKEILKLPDNYNFHIDEKGQNLSGGQKQMIAILRSLYVNPDIILLDEATSALDRKLEKKVLETLYNYRLEGKTIIFVSHKVDVMKRADKVYFLIDGQVKEEGDFNTLVHNNADFSVFIRNEC